MRSTMTTLTLLALMAGCHGQGSMIDTQARKMVENIPSHSWEKLTSRRIYFGHQSVGFNIMDGVTEIGRLEPARAIRVVDSKDPAALAQPCFAHSANGVNKQPDTKLAGFDTLMAGPLGNEVDIAFFKFCYVDITRETDLQRLMGEYKGLMTRMKQQHPNTRFVHVTVPLTLVESGPKAWAKRVLGKPLSGAADNVSRQAFNEMIRSTYGTTEPVFDLASLESTLPSGGRTTFRDNGADVPRLAVEYSDGGSHLNEHGRLWVAAHLLKFLADLS